MENPASETKERHPVIPMVGGFYSLETSLGKAVVRVMREIVDTEERVENGETVYYTSTADYDLLVVANLEGNAFSPNERLTIKVPYLSEDESPFFEIET